MDCHNCGTLPRHLHTAMYRWLRRTTKPIRCLRAPIFLLSYVPIVLLVFCTANTKWFWGKTLKRRFLQRNQKWKWLWVERLTTVGKKTHLTFNCTEVKSTNTERLKTRRGARKKKNGAMKSSSIKGEQTESLCKRVCPQRLNILLFCEWVAGCTASDPAFEKTTLFPYLCSPPTPLRSLPLFWVRWQNQLHHGHPVGEQGLRITWQAGMHVWSNTTYKREWFWKNTTQDHFGECRTQPRKHSIPVPMSLFTVCWQSSTTS